jgi:hypothetical protein
MLSNKEPLYITSSLNFFNLRRLVYFLFFDNISSFIQYPIEGVFISNIKFQIM